MDDKSIIDKITATASLCVLLLSFALLSGCQTGTVEQSLTNSLAGNDPDTQMEFWHSLAERPMTSNDEAFHGFLLFTDGTDSAADYGQRVELLRSRQLLPANFDRAADEAVLRGTMAVAIARHLDIKGGVTMRLFGPTPRYATRELQHKNLYPPCTPNQTFSGTEFLGIIGRIEDYQRVLHPMEDETMRKDDPEAPVEADKQADE